MKQVVSVAGPAGSGKDSIIKGVLARCPNTVFLTNATTRQPRPGEQDGVNYYFMTNEQFLKELAAGNILEHYHRPDTDTYYGTYKPDIEKKIADGKVAFSQIQIVGAKYLKEHYGAVSIFIMPPAPDAFEKRIRSRAPMSDKEWEERLAFTKREIEEESPWYDYRIKNEDGKLDEAIDEVIAILKKEGYTLE
jgi:guanylate kinase